MLIHIHICDVQIDSHSIKDGNSMVSTQDESEIHQILSLLKKLVFKFIDGI